MYPTKNTQLTNNETAVAQLIEHFVELFNSCTTTARCSFVEASYNNPIQGQPNLVVVNDLEQHEPCRTDSSGHMMGGNDG